VLDRLTAARALAALAVFGFHLERWDVLDLPLAGVGYVGVGFFFLLSGFVLTWGTRADVGALTFYRRRFARIWPSHVVMLLAAAVVPVVAVGDGWLRAVPNLFLVQAWFVRDDLVYGMNGVSWSLSCEVFFYLTFPVVMPVLARLRTGGRLATCVGLLVCSAGVALLDGELAYHLPLWHYFEFVTGVVTALAMRDGWRPRLSGPAVLATLTLGLLVSQVLPLPTPELVLVGPFALATAWLAAADLARPARGRARAWMVRAGEASFAFYLVHELVILNLRSLLPYAPAVQALLMLSASCLAAAALHVLVERPANQLLRGGASRSPAHRGGADRAGQPVDAAVDGVSRPALAGAALPAGGPPTGTA
jgi:peptidoglycan/LPS O-acetylase OafA/YrhL